MQSNPSLRTLDNSVYFDKVTDQLKFQTFVAWQQKPTQKKQNELKKDKKEKKDKILKTNAEFTVKLDIGAAKKQLNEMQSKITIVGIKTLIWYFNKVFRHAI